LGAAWGNLSSPHFLFVLTTTITTSKFSLYSQVFDAALNDFNRICNDFDINSKITYVLDCEVWDHFSGFNQDGIASTEVVIFEYFTI
jgi:hypothetical protein